MRFKLKKCLFLIYCVFFIILDLIKLKEARKVIKKKLDLMTAENTTFAMIESEVIIPHCGDVKQIYALEILPVNYKQFKLDMCGKTYVLGLEKVNYTTAVLKCCQLGMKLHTVDSNEKRQCMLRVINSNGGLKNPVWTSIVKYASVKGTIEWMDYNKTIKKSDLLWENKGPGQRSCTIALTDPVKQYPISTELCRKEYEYICEREARTCDGFNIWNLKRANLKLQLLLMKIKNNGSANNSVQLQEQSGISTDNLPDATTTHHSTIQIVQTR